MNPEIYKSVWAGLQQHFIVKSLWFDLGGRKAGCVAVEDMVSAKPPRNDWIVWDVDATVYEKPWKVSGDIIKSREFKLNWFANADRFAASDAVKNLVEDYYRQKKQGELNG